MLAFPKSIIPKVLSETVIVLPQTAFRLTLTGVYLNRRPAAAPDPAAELLDPAAGKGTPKPSSPSSTCDGVMVMDSHVVTPQLTTAGFNKEQSYKAIPPPQNL